MEKKTGFRSHSLNYNASEMHSVAGGGGSLTQGRLPVRFSVPWRLFTELQL
jgi:hypothetical protein